MDPFQEVIAAKKTKIQTLSAMNVHGTNHADHRQSDQTPQARANQISQGSPPTLLEITKLITMLIQELNTMEEQEPSA